MEYNGYKNAIVVESSFGVGFKIYDRAELKKSTIGDYVTIGNDSVVDNCSLEGNNSINRRNFLLRSEIGRFTYTGVGTSIRTAKVGRFCSISWNVSVGGGNHPMDKITTHTISRFHHLDSGFWDKNQIKDDIDRVSSTTCVIGNDVLITSNVQILRDVKIGNGAIIGAGAVVTKDVEPYSIVAGVPAKKIKMRFDDNIIEALEEIQWWHWPIEVIRQNLDLIYSTKVNHQTIEKLREISNSLK